MIITVIRMLTLFIVSVCKKKKNVSTPPSTPPQFLEMVIRFLAEGAASGLNVIAVYVTEILRVTGVDGKCLDGPCLCLL